MVQHKLAVSCKEEEIKTLSQQLQKLQQELAVARKSGTKRELELEQHILKVTDEAVELRDKLEEAEERKQEAVKKMEAAQVESKVLQTWVKELRGQQTAFKVSATM